MNLFKHTYRVALIVTMLATTNANAANIESGKSKASMCAGCHGINGIGLSAEFPNLAGQKKQYLIKQLNAFKSGIRIDPTMKVMATSLSDTDIDNLATYYSSLGENKATPSDLSSVATDRATKTEFPEEIFITMKKSGTLETFPAGVSWVGGPNMLYNAVTPDGKWVLSTSPSSNTVYVFDASNGDQLAIIAVGKAPKGVKITPDGKFAYVSNQNSANISVIDLVSLSVVDRIKVKEGPHNVRFTQDGKTAYVTLQGGAGIGVIDTAAREMVKVIPVPGITGPHNIDLSSDEKTVFIRDFVHHVAVLDLHSGEVRKIIKVGNGHGGIDVIPNGKYAVTAAIGDNIISVIDTETLSVKNIIIGNGPHGIRASKDSKWLYVTITKDNAVAVVSVNTMQVEKKISTGQFPFWIAVQGNL